MRRGALPGGLIGMVALVAAIEGSLARHGLDFTRFYIHDWEAGGRAARRDVKGCGVLCLGDSLVKFGVAPAILEVKLKTRAYNLAVCSGQAPSSYFLLRRALAAGRGRRPWSSISCPTCWRPSRGTTSASGPSCSASARRSTWAGTPGTPGSPPS